MSDKNKWYAEMAIDIAATYLIGWLILGGIAASLIHVGADAGEFGKMMPVLARVAVTYGVFKLLRTFNWLKGVPPKLG